MYDVVQLLPIFSSVLGIPREYSKHEYYFHCPFCNHATQKLAVNMAKGKWHCWHCNASGNYLVSLAKRLNFNQSQIKELKRILADDDVYLSKDESSTSVLALPEEFKPMWIPTKSYEYKNALFYLRSRGITASDILRYGIGYCDTGLYSNRIIIPSYDEVGKLNYFVGRDFFGNSPLKYKNPPVSKNIIGLDYHINWNYPITLCEGSFDAISIKWNAIPLFGKTLPSKLKQKILEKNVKKIYVALDADATKDALHLIQTFMKEGQEVHYVDSKGKDPGEVGFSKMQEHIEDSNSMTFRDVVLMKLS